MTTYGTDFTRRKVLVCGGRSYNDKDTVFRTLNGLCGDVSDEYPLGTVCLTIVHGKCPTGADFLADQWAVVNWVAIKEYPADWKRWGAAAGPIRNQEMIDKEKPDLVVAFSGGAGTRDMVDRARRAGIEVMEIA